MKLLDRYVGGAVVRGCVLVALALLAAFTVLALVEELDDIGKGRYRIKDALIFVSLTTPRRLFDLLPMAALLGSITSLGALASGSELLAMEAAGVSRLRIGWAALQAGLVVMGGGLAVAQFVAPPLDEIAQELRSRAQTEAASVPTAHGFWSRERRRFVNVGRVLEPGMLADVDLYEFDEEANLRVFTHAERARLQKTQWLLMDVEQKVLTDRGIVVRKLETLAWNSFLTARDVGLLVLQPQSLSFSDLFQYVRYLRASGQDPTRYELALWQNASQPLAAGAMVMLAIPFAFGLLRVAGVGQRIVLGSVVGIVYHLAAQIVARLGLLLQLHPAATTLGPVVAAVGAALWLFRRVP